MAYSRSGIPALAGLALTFGCADRLPGPDTATGSGGEGESGGPVFAFTGSWNLIRATSDYYGSVYTQTFPQVYGYGGVCDSGWGLDLIVLDDTRARWVQRYGYACEGMPFESYSYAQEMEIEVLSPTRFAVYTTYYGGYTDTTYTDTGYTATSVSETSGYTAGTTSNPTTGSIPERELLFTCTVSSPGLRCEPDGEAWLYEFARPRCTTHSQCASPAECWFGQCAVPMSY